MKKLLNYSDVAAATLSQVMGNARITAKGDSVLVQIGPVTREFSVGGLRDRNVPVNDAVSGIMGKLAKCLP